MTRTPTRPWMLALCWVGMALLLAQLGCAGRRGTVKSPEAASEAASEAAAESAAESRPAPPSPPAAADEALRRGSPPPPLPPEAVPRPETSDPAPAGPILLKVGLASDLIRFDLPCCDESLTVEVPAENGSFPLGSSFRLATSMRVEPAPAAVRAAVYRLQVAALKDETQARQLADRLARQLGQPGDAHFDAGVDLYRVRVGSYPSREAADRARRALPPGMQGNWIVAEGGEITAPALRLDLGGNSRLVPGRWLSVAAPSGGFVRFEGRRYRGRLLLFLNDRGTLNVINELPLEDYLRGVVPREMGPILYDRLEALKAQAVAARTYTLRNLGEFLAEGYDICATPRCQVYGGAEDEHFLSDRAITETADQVLIHEEQPIDALYTATCGGHTEDVSVVFPEKAAPYLRAVSCIEAEVAAPVRTNPYRSWRRFRSDRELAARVETRYPGLGFQGLEILERGRSGRVARLAIVGRGGRREIVAGLAIRWLLDLPETTFTAERVPGSGQRAAGWRFVGRGWGHGVGMCQNGAFAMAGRGQGYRDILAHYYSGAQLVRVRARR